MKIEIFYNNEYICTTMKANTCKEAIKTFIAGLNTYSDSFFKAKMLSMTPQGIDTNKIKAYKTPN